MPRMDGTGPLGQGAGTGRKLGRCGAGNKTDRRYANGKGYQNFISSGDNSTSSEKQNKN